MSFHLKQILLALDQLLNALMGGWADETISSRLYRNRYRSFWWTFWFAIVNLLAFNKWHCYQSYIAELSRSQLPPAYKR